MGLFSKAGFGVFAIIAALFNLSGQALAQDADAGEKSFRVYCGYCHHPPRFDSNGIGPNLKGVVGRRAASYPNFNYSSALTSAGLTWNEATLDAWLARPQAVVSGTKMAFTGIRNAAERANIIAFLKNNP